MIRTRQAQNKNKNRKPSISFAHVVWFLQWANSKYQPFVFVYTWTWLATGASASAWLLCACAPCLASTIHMHIHSVAWPFSEIWLTARLSSKLRKWNQQCSHFLDWNLVSFFYSFPCEQLFGNKEICFARTNQPGTLGQLAFFVYILNFPV